MISWKKIGLRETALYSSTFIESKGILQSDGNFHTYSIAQRKKFDVQCRIIYKHSDNL